MRKRRKFTREFKEQAVALANQPGVTKREIAEDLGIDPKMLGRWCREWADSDQRGFPGHGQARDAELAALKRELAKVRKERDFLREAAVFIAKASR